MPPHSAPARPPAQDLDRLFGYHHAIGDQPERIEKVRAAAKAFAQMIVENTATTADQSAAIRMIRETLLTIKDAIELE